MVWESVSRCFGGCIFFCGGLPLLAAAAGLTSMRAVRSAALKTLSEKKGRNSAALVTSFIRKVQISLNLLAPSSLPMCIGAAPAKGC